MAAGDITPSTPRQDTGLTLSGILMRHDQIVLFFRDGFSRELTATITNGRSVGFNYSTGQTTEVSAPNLFNAVRSALGITNARVSAAIAAAKDAGVVSITGTVA